MEIYASCYYYYYYYYVNYENVVQVRRHVYHDSDSLDTAFDAGGKVSIGTVLYTSQMLIL